MFQKIVSPLRTFGYFAGLLYIIDKIFARISTRLNLYFYELMVQPIPDQDLIPASLAKHLEIREIKRGDPDLDRMPARPEIKDFRFKQNAVCLGAYQKGELIGYIWFCYNRYEEDEVRCTYELSPNATSVFDFDLYIFPKHRMGLGFIGIWNGVNEYLRDKNIKYTYSRLTRFNLGSRRAHTHLGWKCVAKTIFLQAWQLEGMVATIFPFVSVTWAPAGRIRLHLSAEKLIGNHPSL